MASPEERDLQRIAEALRRIKEEAKEALPPIGRLKGELQGFKEVLGLAGIPVAGIKMPPTRQWGGRYRRSYLESFGMGAAQQLPPYLRTQAAEALGGQPMAESTKWMTEMAGGAQNLQRVLDTASAALGGVRIGVEGITKVMPDAVRGITSFAVKTEDGIGRAVVQMDRLGNTTVRTGRVARDFFEMVTRNIGKVVQWAIAVGLVYGALRKVSQVMTDMREFETLFADIAIVMGITSDAATQYFDAMYKIAKITGITVKDVAKSYDDARRATADITDETQRAATAEQLLTDAMILAQIAGIDSAQAFDILVGALRQVGYGLDEGIKLLDKWIAVSRVSVTSVYGLAQAFAITGTAAQTAGVDVDQLTGMIAGMMEVSVLTETQAANAIRAFMSSFTTERSVSALQQHGFAVKDLDGNYRSLWEILTEIAAAYQTGALSPTGLKEITDAIGGGYRRAAQVEALIKGWPRVQFAAAASMDAHGEAASALGIKMDTLQIAINQLTSSWQRLAETLMEAGLVEDLTRIVNLMTSLLDIVATLTEKLGPFLIKLAEMMALIGLARYVGPRIGAIAGIGGGLGMQMALPGMGAGMMAGAAGTAAKFAGPLAIAGTALIPIITEGLTQEAAWQSAGGILAGAVGFALGGPMGAVIGATIGQGIVSVIQREQEKAAVPLAERPLEQLISERRDISEALRQEAIPGVPYAFTAERRQQLEEQLRLYDEEVAARKTITEEGLEEESDAYKRYYGYLYQLERDLGKELPSQRKRTMELLQQYAAGEITRAEYRASIAQLEATYNIIFKAFDKLHEEIGVSLPEMFDVLAGTSAEAYDEIAARISALVALDIQRMELEAMIAEGLGDQVRDVTKLRQLEQQRTDIVKELSMLYEMAKEAAIVKPELPPIFDFSRIAEEDLPAFYDAVVAKMQEAAALVGMDWKDMFEESAYIGVTEGLQLFLVDPSINRQFASLIMRAWEDAAEEMDLRRIKDIGELPAKAWFAKLKEFVDYYQRLFAQIGFFPDIGEITLMLGPQNEIFRLMTSQEALRYAIEDLRDITEEQTDVLRGHYNIPAGYIVPTPWDYYATTGSRVAGPINYPPSVLEEYYGYQFGGGGVGAGLGIPSVGGVEAGQWMERIPRQPGWDVGDWTGLIMQYALQAGVDPRIIAAIMQIESGGRPDVWGAPTKWGRAAGLMQIMPFHAGRLRPGEDLMQPEANIRVGVEIFKELLDKYGGDVMKAVAGYYGGVIGGEITPTGETYLEAFKKGFAGLFGAGAGEIQQVQGIPEIQRILESTKISEENYSAQSINQMIQMVGLLRSILVSIQALGRITITAEPTTRRGEPIFEVDVGEEVLSNIRSGGPIVGGAMES